jgi:hypothetical protein
MIFRVLSIIAALAAAVGLWFAYGELKIFRRTIFWEYRYIIFGVGAFFALSMLESMFGWIRTKFGSDTQSH